MRKRAFAAIRDTSGRHRTNEVLREAARFGRAILDSLSSPIVVVNEDGTIQAVNQAWKTFALENGSSPELVSEGVNYFAVCAAAQGSDKEGARRFADGIRGVLSGELPIYEEEHACHSPTQERWFYGRVTPFPGPGPRRAVIAHEDITGRKRITKDLEASEERYRSLFELHPSPLLAYDVETLYFLAANKGAVEQYGFSREEFLTMKVTEVRPPEDIPRLLEKIKEHRELGRRTAGIWRHRKKDGTLINVEIVDRSMFLGGRRAQVVSAIDVTDKLKAEEARRASEERVALALSASKMGVWDWDLRDDTIFWSPECLELFGMNDFDGRLASFTALLHPEDAPAVLAAAEKAVEDGVDCVTEFRANDSAGVVKWFSILGRCDYDKEGKPLRLLGMIRDITKEKKAAVDLKDSELQLRMLFEQSPFGVLIYDSATALPVVFNDTACRQLGYSREECARRRIVDCDAAMSPEKMESLMHQVVEAEFAPFETKHRAKSGEIRDVQIIAQPMRLSERTLIHCIVVDMTERKRANEQLRLQGAALQSAANAIVITNSDGLIEWVNPAFTKLTGYASVEAIGQTLGSLNCGLQGGAFLDGMLKTIASGNIWSGEMVSKRKDGILYDHELTIAPVLDETGRISHFVAVQQDITARKRVQEQLAQSELRYRTLFGMAQDAIVVSSSEKVIDCNPVALDLYGCTRDQFLKRLPRTFSPERQPDGLLSIEKSRNYVEAALAGKPQRFEWDHQREDGSRFDADIAMNAFSLENSPVIMAIVRDITERKRAERALQQSKKELRELYARLNTLREDERRQLSRDIHDYAGQLITALKFDISSAAHNARSFPDSTAKQTVTDRLESAKQLMNEIHVSLVKIATYLRPSALNSGLLLALKTEMSLLAEREGWDCRLDFPERELSLSDHAATMLFRIFQESITNIARHASATTVLVTMTIAGDNLVLKIEDNGKGLPQKKTEGSLGLLGMQERAGSLGGLVTFPTPADCGTIVSVSIPYAENSL